MTPERKNIGMKISDFGKQEKWEEVARTFINNPEAVQEIVFTDGPLAGKGFTMSMLKDDVGEGGYIQVDSVTDFNLGTIFMNYCMEHGEVLTGGVYRFRFDTIDDIGFVKNS